MSDEQLPGTEGEEPEGEEPTEQPPRRRHRKNRPGGGGGNSSAFTSESARAAALKSHAARKAKGAASETEALHKAAVSSLQEWRASVGTTAVWVMPVASTYVAQTPDDVLESMVRLAGRNARLLKWLAEGGDVLAGIVVAQWCAGMVVAAGVDAHRVDPYSGMADRYGIPAIIDQLAAEGRITLVEPGEEEQGATAAGAEGDAPGLATVSA